MMYCSRKHPAGSALLLTCSLLAIMSVILTGLWWTVTFYAHAHDERMRRLKQEHLTYSLFSYGIAYVCEQEHSLPLIPEILIYKGSWFDLQGNLTVIPDADHIQVCAKTYHKKEDMKEREDAQKIKKDGAVFQSQIICTLKGVLKKGVAENNQRSITRFHRLYQE